MNLVMRYPLAIVAAGAALAIGAGMTQTAVGSTARPCGSRAVGGYFKVNHKRAHVTCFQATNTLADLLLVKPRAPYITGTHHYKVPRTGTNYRKGEDWWCTLRVRILPNPDEPKTEYALADGSCAYRGHRSTRFFFDGKYG